MKLILTQDVSNLGLIGDTVEVKPGYARNFLLPRKLALVANAANKAVYESVKNQRGAQLAREKRDAEERAEALDKASVTIAVSVGEEGSGMELRASAPYGVNILVAIGASKPLFDKARIPVEPSGRYLVALTKVIENLRDQDSSFAEEYVYVFVITQDNSRRGQRTQDKRSKRLVSEPR